jgi:hypothetical protein
LEKLLQNVTVAAAGKRRLEDALQLGGLIAGQLAAGPLAGSQVAMSTRQQPRRGFSFLLAHPGHPHHGSWGRHWSQSGTARQGRCGTSVTPRGLIHV